MDDEFDYQIGEYSSCGPFLYFWFAFRSNQQVEVFNERPVPHKVYWINEKRFQDVGWDEDDNAKLDAFIADSGGLQTIINEMMEVLQRQRGTDADSSNSPTPNVAVMETRRPLVAFTPNRGFSTPRLRSSEEWETENARLLAENQELRKTNREQADTIRKQADTIRTLANTNAQQKDDVVTGSERG